eukprot:TRINITY_DN16995_c0_g1_i4.p1 TRINITY_DN16995_c0_g1~~TRINITY_DN16995_c0_g1_i4.p1  ORF type:complete len:330 (-),score=36.40 TRINITY_DN16995_c0_g1_i4:566-1555(-)
MGAIEPAWALSLFLAPLCFLSVLTALASDAWGGLQAGPPACRHEITGKFGLRQLFLHIRFLPDPKTPWTRQPPPLYLPWVPLRCVVMDGPLGTTDFLAQRKFSSTDDVAPGVDEPELYFDAPDMPAPPSIVYRGYLHQPFSWARKSYKDVLDTAELVHFCGCAAAALTAAGLCLQVAATVLAWRTWRILGRLPSGVHAFGSVRFVLRLASMSYFGAAGCVLAGFVQYAASVHNKVKVLVSEFTFEHTNGQVAIWPASIEVTLELGGWAFALGGVVALVCGLTLRSGVSGLPDLRSPARASHAEQAGRRKSLLRKPTKKHRTKNSRSSKQ